jgi:ankyrin repeat protein
LARVVAAGGRIDQRTASKKMLHTDDPTTLLYAGATPLHYAVESRNVDAAGYLLTHGAKVDAKTEAGMTPLFAAMLHHATPAMLELLLRHGADVNASVDGVNPRLIAHLRKESEIERLLASAGGTYSGLRLGEAKIQTWMAGSDP